MFSKEELKLMNKILIFAKNQSKAKDFNIEKFMIDSLGLSDHKYKEEIK